MRFLLGAARACLVLAIVSPVIALQTHANGVDRGRAGAHVTGRNAPRSRHKPARPSPVTMTVSLGYDGNYRTQDWTPVRVTVHNRTAHVINGMVSVPDAGTPQNGPPRQYASAYQTPVLLPPGGTKQVTLYVPGFDFNGEIPVTYSAGGVTLQSQSPYVNAFDPSQVAIGALSTDPAAVQWLANLDPNTTSVRLTAATLDPVPEALATFDVLVVSNVDAGRLSAAQRDALVRYVENGGTLVEVGGPDWQETLKPLPAVLLPGVISGTRTLRDLRGLTAMGRIALPAHGAPATVAVLSHPRGTVVAQQAGVPLVVNRSLGSGRITFLAFDPSVDPVHTWPHITGLLFHIIRMAAPYAVARQSLPSGFNNSFPLFFNSYGGELTSELSNVPAAALPSLILFVLLTILYVILLGPANYLVLRRLGRRELSWITIPLLAALCVVLTFAVALRLKGNTVLVNTVTVVNLDGSQGPRPVTLFSGLFAPVRGDYTLTYGAPALASALQSYTYYGPGTQHNGSALGLSVQQGAGTSVRFLAMNMWSMREIALQTWANVPGAVTGRLHLAADGRIVGTVHNGTGLKLLHPGVLAGRAFAKLPDLPAGATVRVSVRPAADTHDESPIWFHIYGQPQYGNGRFFGKPFFGGPFIPYANQGFGGGGYCCSPPQPTENNLSDRIRNVAVMLPNTQSVTANAEVIFLGWSEQPLGQLTVDGTSPQRRDLDLIAAPLGVSFPAGRFKLLPGTISSRLVDVVPAGSSNGCCYGSVQPGQQMVMVGPGGSTTFQFTLPHNRPVHFASLHLQVNAGGASGAGLGHVFDWQRRAWVPVDLSLGEVTLSHPDRFVSAQHTLLLKLTPGRSSPMVNIANPEQNLQLSGTAVAG